MSAFASRAEVKQRAAAAVEAGRRACQQGRSAIPALDPELSTLLSGVEVGDGLPIVRGWVRGYTRERRRPIFTLHGVVPVVDCPAPVAIEAPALDAWGATLLVAALVGAAVWRLRR